MKDIRSKKMAEITEDEFTASFRCPETYVSDEDKRDAIEDELAWLGAHYGSLNTNQIVEFRMSLLRARHCDVTLNNISNNSK